MSSIKQTEKYGVQFQAITKRIVVGRLNKARTLFVSGSMEDHTNRILDEAIKYIEAEFGGAMQVTHGDDEVVRVEVTRIRRGGGSVV